MKNQPGSNDETPRASARPAARDAVPAAPRFVPPAPPATRFVAGVEIYVRGYGPGASSGAARGASDDVVEGKYHATIRGTKRLFEGIRDVKE